MSAITDGAATRRARSHIARRRGALIGPILIVLGAWGALVPFIGPYFHYAYTPDVAWHWTSSRGWLEVLPGAVTVLGGLLVLVSHSRTTAILGAWLAAAAGAWFAIGSTFEPVLHVGALGTPAGTRPATRLFETLGMFDGLGVLIVFFAAAALGRLSVRSLADIQVARRELDEEARLREPAEPTTVAPVVDETSRRANPERLPEDQEVRRVDDDPAATGTPERQGADLDEPADVPAESTHHTYRVPADDADGVTGSSNTSPR
ncbi:hypothetical protein SAMN05444157_3541 [Frankineae bacterium MT45]|nr:hypothetical protein SAMN05444157_3541 [Frankineae bacterium MT45]